MPIGHPCIHFCLIILFYKFKGLPKQPFQSVKKVQFHMEATGAHNVRPKKFTSNPVFSVSN